MVKPSYIGRFAPSPTGPLHFGSLLAALASYLDAHAHNGKWLLRIDDIDPPREHPGASDSIQRTLEHYGLHWHDKTFYQSSQVPLYRELKDQLLGQQLAYPCDCSRKELVNYGGNYPGFCRKGPRGNGPAAIRIHCNNATIVFHDRIQGDQKWPLVHCGGDFIIWRKDDLVAYQLAAAADDYTQHISHIVRGADLLDSTPRQIHLQHLLDYPTPSYAHIPVILNSEGHKLSKQNFATPLPLKDPRTRLQQALAFLGQNPPQDLSESSLEDIITWGIQHWKNDAISPNMTLSPSDSSSNFAV